METATHLTFGLIPKISTSKAVHFIIPAMDSLLKIDLGLHGNASPGALAWTTFTVSHHARPKMLTGIVNWCFAYPKAH